MGEYPYLGAYTLVNGQTTLYNGLQPYNWLNLLKNGQLPLILVDYPKYVAYNPI